MARPRKPARLTLDRGEWRIIDGEIRRRTGCGEGDRSGAERALALYVAERDRQRPQAAVEVDDATASEPALVSVATCLDAYGRSKAGTPNAGLTGIHMSHLLAWWGDRTLAQVKASACRSYVAWRTSQVWKSPGATGPGKAVSQGTARRELETLSAAIGAWHKEYNLTSRPVIWLPPKGKAHPDWLTEGEVERLLKAARAGRAAGHLERFIAIAYYSGSRAGAVLGLRWEHDPDGVEGHVDFAATTLHRAGPRAPQTRKRNPSCRIHDKLLPLLLAWREADREAGYTHVVHEGGRPLDRIGQSFATAAQAAALRVREIDSIDRVAAGWGMPTPHILRHTRATLMLRAGLSYAEVAEYLGMSAAMVEKVYGHHHVEHQRRAAAA